MDFLGTFIKNRKKSHFPDANIASTWMKFGHSMDLGTIQLLIW